MDNSTLLIWPVIEKYNRHDYKLLNHAAKTFNTTSYTILENVMVACNNQLYINHLDVIFNGLVAGNIKLPLRYKKYIIAMLAGEEIFISNTEQAVLLV